MSFMKNIQNKLSHMSEEVVHHVDYDEEARKKAEAEEAYEYDYEPEILQELDEPTVEPSAKDDTIAKEGLKLSDFNPFARKNKEEKSPKPPKPPKEKKVREPREKPVKAVQEKPVREKEEKVESEETSIPERLKGMLGWLKKQEESEETEDSKALSQQQANDILELLEIPASYKVPADVFMKQDLDSIGKFNYQMPKGYDIGEVRTVIDQFKNSIEYFQDKLQERNDHIAKLATTIDKLQTDLYNSKFETEIASSVNIIPTEESEDIARENLDLKTEIRRLEYELKKWEMQAEGYEPELSAEDIDQINSLQDQLSIAQRENEEAREENRELRARLASLEEAFDDPQRFMESDDETPEVVYDLDYREQFGEGLEGTAPLPDLDGLNSGDSDILPDIDFDSTGASSEDPIAAAYAANPNFTYVDEPLEDVLPPVNWDEDDEEDYDDTELPSFEPESPEQAKFAELLAEDDGEEDFFNTLQEEWKQDRD